MKLWGIQHLEWNFGNFTHRFEVTLVLLNINFMSYHAVESLSILNIIQVLLLLLFEAKNATPVRWFKDALAFLLLIISDN